ncbi:MAG: hypothetical protein LBV54_02775 [Puniceicoccales bacterium]|nr:hypothetical protein [Puniceicoccales bacterium]
MTTRNTEGGAIPTGEHHHRHHHYRHHRSRSNSSDGSRSRGRNSDSDSFESVERQRISLSSDVTFPVRVIQDEGIPITVVLPENDTTSYHDSDSGDGSRHRHYHHHHYHSSSENRHSGHHGHLSHHARSEDENEFSRKSRHDSDEMPAQPPSGIFGNGLRQRLAAWFPRSVSDEPSVSRREKIVGVLAAAALVVPAVLYGAVQLEVQFLSLGISAAAFLFLFLPVFDGGKSNTALDSIKALVRFPLFWLGLLLFALMACQGLNPEWTVIVRTYTMRLFPEAQHIHWLPTGVDSPFDMDRRPGGMNAFRQMIIFGGPWLLLCALWAGIHRRRAIVGIAWGVLTVGFVLAAWGVQMRITGQQHLGPYNTLNTSFFATFLYQNHAGAWLSLLFGSALALTFWHWGKSATVSASGGPHLLSAGLALCLACASVCTLSFGGMFSLGTLLFVGAPVGVLWTLFRKGVNLNAIIGGAVAAAMLAFLAFVFFETTNLQETEAKLSRKFKLVENARIDDREPFRRATWSMVEFKDYEKVWTGWGAGSYRWTSPHFFKRIKEFRHRDGSFERANYAHCDWLQMLVEWGVAGVALVAAAFLWMAAWLLRRLRQWSPATFVLALALVLFIGHASMDFLNYSMPVLSLVAFTAVAAARFVLPRSKAAAKQY